MSLQIQSQTSKIDTVHLILDGKLDAITAPELEKFINDQMNNEIKTLILDLGNLSFISSAGLRIFAKARKMIKSRSGMVYFTNLSPQVKKVFDIVKAVPLSEVFQNVGEIDAYLEKMQNKVSQENQ
ncbi:STAS domain-containing protein [Cronbergia sp. UHCC 0137]|uniref:STAS domain-containing protein n=1 Tax=Cronbergia sp. UHCC 0137 TaxID=3110239 RepID=UPI002B1FDD1D|nr:STAS domain-containing protein [Cronbergia sp. UHCC 0137]MEA5619117.1 STAS domain-containing protein [Cronbergia sp. UHCC 0137]